MDPHCTYHLTLSSNNIKQPPEKSFRLYNRGLPWFTDIGDHRWECLMLGDGIT